MSIVGYEAKNKGVRGSICKECAEGIDCSNLSEVTSREFRDVYCVNCYVNLQGAAKSKPDNVNEKLCAILDLLVDDIYPCLDTGPGEKAEVKEIAPGVTKSEFPEDASGQVVIANHTDELDNILNKLSERGNLRYINYKNSPTVVTSD